MNETTKSGAALAITGVGIAIVGVAAFFNYSVTCYPEGFPCELGYRVWFLVPLYSASGLFFVFGSILAILGTAVTFLGLFRSKGGQN